MIAQGNALGSVALKNQALQGRHYVTDSHLANSPLVEQIASPHLAHLPYEKRRNAKPHEAPNCNIYEIAFMRRTIFILGGICLMLMSQGCKNPPADEISKAVAATNVLFKPNLQQPITLSATQAEAIKQIVGKFSERSKVRTEKDILPYESGRFILGDVQFGWLGRMLYIHDAKTEQYYVVEDALLGEMAKAFFKVQGQPPLATPSQEEWKEILSVLEQGK